MITIADILSQGIPDQKLQLLIVIHVNKAKKEQKQKPPEFRGVEYALSVCLLAFEGDLLQKLLVAFLFHEDGGAERTIAGYQGADAILRSAVLAFMHNLETFYRVGIEKIFQHQLGLAAAVTIAFFGGVDLNGVVEEAGHIRSIACFHGADHFINTGKKGKSGKR